MAVIKSTSLDLHSGMLLSKEIFEQMDSQSHLFRIQYDCYPDGIIYGFIPTEESGKLYLSSGLIKSHGKYFFSDKKINIHEFLDLSDEDGQISNTKYTAMAFVSNGIEKVNEGIISECLILKLLDRNELKNDDILIAEFQYHKGKRQWKSESRNAVEILEAQLNEEGYYYSFLNVNYSMPYESVFSPVICRMMKECLKEKKNKSNADLMLLFMLSQNQTISNDVLKTWFEANGISVASDERKSVIRLFLDCIKKELFTRQAPAICTKTADNQKHEDGYGI